MFFIRPTLTKTPIDGVHTFIFGNVFGGTVRPCCWPFSLCETGLETNGSGEGDDFPVVDFGFAVFFTGEILGSLNTIPITIVTHKHMKILNTTCEKTMHIKTGLYL